MKAMISQPMAGKTEQEIADTRAKAITELEKRGYEVENSLFTDDYRTAIMVWRGALNIPLRYLAMSLEAMSKCSAVYFCKGWEAARGCRIEHGAAKEYGLAVIYEEAANA